MSEKTVYPEWQYKPVRLTTSEIDDPIDVIKKFLAERALPDHRSSLFLLQEAALASSKIDFIDAQEAAHIVGYCRDLEVLIEATAVLCGNLDQIEPA